VCVLKNPFDVENGDQFELARSSSYQVFTGLMKRLGWIDEEANIILSLHRPLQIWGRCRGRGL